MRLLGTHVAVLLSWMTIGILTIYWLFPPPPGAGTSGVTTYTADIAIDNLKFIQ